MSSSPEDPQELPYIPELAQDYEILRELGRGGTAVVYLAREIGVDRYVAIKIMRSGHLQDEEAVARMVREAKTIARLQHPNIVMLLGVRRIGERGQALILQYIPGTTVKERIRREGPLPIPVVERILTDLGSALQYAHQHRIVHRDIKPENIFLDEDTGASRLADFGIARFWDTESGLTMPGSAVGTPNYMSPEQVDGKDLDGRSDLYSVGLTAWEMLTGQPPWAGETLYKIIYKQKTEDLPPLAELRPECPLYIRASIEKALRKDRNDRWRDAGEFLAALQNPYADLARTGRIPTNLVGSSPSPRTDRQAAQAAAKPTSSPSGGGTASRKAAGESRPRPSTHTATPPLRDKAPSAEEILDSETVLLDPETLKRARSGASGPEGGTASSDDSRPEWLTKLETGTFRQAQVQPRIQNVRRPPSNLVWNAAENKRIRGEPRESRLPRPFRNPWVARVLLAMAVAAVAVTLLYSSPLVNPQAEEGAPGASTDEPTASSPFARQPGAFAPLILPTPEGSVAGTATGGSTSPGSGNSPVGTAPVGTAPAGIDPVVTLPLQGPAGQRLSERVVVRVVDGGGEGVGAVDVRWEVTSGGGTLERTVGRTGPGGTASNAWTLGPDPGPQALRVHVAGRPELALIVTAVAVP